MIGRLVSFNQFNIVIGISIAFFTNYLILSLSESTSSIAQLLGMDQWQWRWMLGIEFLPAAIYFLALQFVPESPRWLVLQGRDDEGFEVLSKVNDLEKARVELNTVKNSLAEEVDE